MADVQRDTVVKFCNLIDSNKNGKYGLYRKKLGDGRHRIMQTSGCDLAVKRENFEVHELDLNQEITNGVVLVFPPSTGKTGTKPVAVPLPDFPHEVSANGMHRMARYELYELKLPSELNTERMTNHDFLLKTEEIETLKIFFDQIDGVDFENFIKDDVQRSKMFNGPNGKIHFENTKRFIRNRYNNTLRQRYCADNFGWKLPARMQISNGHNEYAAQVAEVVYWHDLAEKKGIENTFMRFPWEEGDIPFRGAVVFDFSYKTLMPEACSKNQIRWDEARLDVPNPSDRKLEDLINSHLEPDFEGVKTLGDIQDHIVKIAVDHGDHPSNPGMEEAQNSWTKMVINIAKSIKKKAEGCDDPKKGRESAEEAVEKSEADEKKQRLKEKIREKRLKRQGK